jgi:hypothetical protein
LVAEAKIEALAMLVRRLVVDAILKTPDPQRALLRPQFTRVCSWRTFEASLDYSVFNSTALNLPRPDFGAIWC